MRHQRVEQVAGVKQQENDRDAEAQLFVRHGELAVVGDASAGEVEDRRHEQRQHHQDQKRGEQAGPGPVEGLSIPPDAADQHREPEPEQAGPHDRACQLGLDHLRFPVCKHEQREDDFGNAAETDVQKAADRWAGPFGHLLGGAPGPVGEHRDGCRPREEDPERRSADEVFEREGQGHEQQEEKLCHPPPNVRRRQTIFRTATATA